MAPVFGPQSFLIMALALITGAECVVFTSEQEQAIDSVILAAMECKNFPGLSLSVVKGEDSWTKGYGVADIPSGTPIDENTAFMTASVGKSFTMTLLGMLLEENGYDWDTKLADIKGLDLLFNSLNLTREMTSADMLSHRTGLSTSTVFGIIGRYPVGTTLEMLSRRTEYIPSIADFRSEFLYNNMMYLLCAYVSEVLGQKPWEELMTSRIFEPLGMTSTRIIKSDTDVYKDGVAKPYTLVDGVMRNSTFGIYKLPPSEPVGAFLSTAVDMATWIRFNLRRGRTDSGLQLITPEFLDSAYQNQNDVNLFNSRNSTPEFPVDDVTTGYGYAWFVSMYRGFRRLWHDGANFSYMSIIWLFPDQNIGVYLAVNGPALTQPTVDGFKAILSYISDVLLEEEPWLDVRTVCTYPIPWRNRSDYTVEPPRIPDLANSTTNLHDYVGTYGNYLYPDVNIVLLEDSKSGDKLHLVMNQLKGDLIQLPRPDLFAFRLTDPLEFVMEFGTAGVFYPTSFHRNAFNVVQTVIVDFYYTGVTFDKDVRFHDLSIVMASKATTVSVLPFDLCMLFTILLLATFFLQR